MLPLVDQREIEVDGDFTFARADGLPHYAPVGRDDSSEAAAGDRAEVGGAGVRGNLSLLVSVQPSCSANDKVPTLQRVLPDCDFGPLCKPIAEHGAGEHRRVDLLAIGHHRVPCERVVVLKTCQLTNTCDLTVDSAQT